MQPSLTRLLAAAALPALALAATAVSAQEITLRVHHFLPTSSTTHADFIQPWADRLEAESEGRLRVEIYPSMQLGGKPPQLFDQARDGVADVVWTLTGYTAGRFPMIEVFELPFVPATAEATSQAAQAFYEQYAREELADVHVLMVHTHAAGSFHMRRRPIRSLADLPGAKIRAPTRVINKALGLLGATPVGMPVPQVPEALSKGVVDGAMLPYEVTLPLRVHELTDSHTEIRGDRGLYTAVFLFAMNKKSYADLPADLRALVDQHSGLPLAQEIGAVWDRAEITGRQAAEAQNAAFYSIEGDELARWQAATQPVLDDWVAEMNAAGHDGPALLAAARDLVQHYSR